MCISVILVRHSKLLHNEYQLYYYISYILRIHGFVMSRSDQVNLQILKKYMDKQLQNVVENCFSEAREMRRGLCLMAVYAVIFYLKEVPKVAKAIFIGT
ncbi:hypothetical protein L6452_22795 [Arctium lappa]|uniref:Uncharacterized protein n=1 Tax=Arctium lappa TaxID=4217 RepID=A0ACB9B1K5_ARCLA|nr:hypothetical protein L6452_22795 [Arctium lappa]